MRLIIATPFDAILLLVKTCFKVIAYCSVPTQIRRESAGYHSMVQAHSIRVGQLEFVRHADDTGSCS
jgi:hypothetical protein